MRKIEVRSAFAYDADQVSLETGIDTGTESVVQQQFAEEVDINTIVRRFGLTGELPNGLAMPMSGDFSGVGDFHEAMNLLKQAESEFMKLPGDVRERFGHDPARVIAFLEDDKNREEAIKLGMIPKPPEKTRDMVQAIDELAAKLVK